MFDELSKTELAPDVLIDKIYTSLSELSLTYVHQAAKYTSLANKFSNEEGLSAPTTTLRQIDLGEETSQLRLFTAACRTRTASWRFYNWREREGAERHKSVANCAQQLLKEQNRERGREEELIFNCSFARDEVASAAQINTLREKQEGNGPLDLRRHGQCLVKQEKIKFYIYQI